MGSRERNSSLLLSSPLFFLLFPLSTWRIFLQPDIVFFGEQLPKRFHDCLAADKDEADLVLVMGSSLKMCVKSYCPG